MQDQPVAELLEADMRRSQSTESAKFHVPSIEKSLLGITNAGGEIEVKDQMLQMLQQVFHQMFYRTFD